MTGRNWKELNAGASPRTKNGNRVYLNPYQAALDPGLGPSFVLIDQGAL